MGDSDEPMTSLEIYNLMSYKKRLEEDIRIVDRATLEDLNLEAVGEYVNCVKIKNPNFSRFSYEIGLEKLGIIRKIDNQYKPTIAGILCFGICPELVLPQLVITATV